MKKTKPANNLCFLNYGFCKNNQEMQKMFADLQSKFYPLIKRFFPQHYLLKHNPASYLGYLGRHSESHPLFLRFNVKELYLSMSKLSIEPVLAENYEELTGNLPPAELNQQLYLAFDSKCLNEPDHFTRESFISELKFDKKCTNHFCPNGWNHKNKLSYFVAAIYMSGLCHTLSRWPFLCFHDEFVVLFQSKAEIAECLLLAYLRLNRIGLDFDPESICSGRTDEKSFQFMGFECKGDRFDVPAEEEKKFRHKIIGLTTLTKQYKDQKAFIKQLNRQINTFGNHYKHGEVAATFARLDKFIRKRVRQFLSLEGDLKGRTPDLPHTSAELCRKLKLASLKKLSDAGMPGMKYISFNVKNLQSEKSLGFSKVMSDKLLGETIHRYKELCYQQKIVVKLLEHLSPLSDEIIR